MPHPPHTPHPTPDRREQLLTRLARERVEPARQPGQPPRVDELWSATDALARHADCPSPGDIELLVAGTLRGRKQTRVRAHLEGCGACRSYAQRLREATRHPAPPAPTAPPPRGEITLGHVLGLTLAGILLLTANTAILDVLSGLEVAVPVERSLQLPPKSQRVPATSLDEVTNEPDGAVVQPVESEVEQPQTAGASAPVAEPEPAAKSGEVTPPAETKSEAPTDAAVEPGAKPATSSRLEPDVRS